MKPLLFIALLALAGCASSQIEVEQSDRYEKLDRINHIKTQPVPTPKLPEIQVETVRGADVAVLDLQGVNTLNEYRAAQKQNEKALELLLVAHNGLVDQRNLMLENLRLEEKRANFYAEQYAHSENSRRQEASDYRLDLVIHKAMIVILGIALVF